MNFVFRKCIPDPAYLLSPGIMGWFGFVPFMECYHGVVSMQHRVSGTLHYNNEKYHFNTGAGYIEKDWGRSFPQSWVWMQANPFKNSDASFMLSIARIPWMGHEFTGVIGYLYHQGKVRRFATYLGDRVRELRFKNDELRITLGKRKRHLTVTATPNGGGQLAAPVKGKMDRSMKESLNGILQVELKDAHNGVLFSDHTSLAGLEISGNTDELLKR
ncbi:MAG: tocopherol cyclase family protein [Candidatus Marinimicrobia bacterium]|nr:tocopherol cyclase family protein [Candidatus Neomarinimicrobiota bacterium]